MRFRREYMPDRACWKGPSDRRCTHPCRSVNIQMPDRAGHAATFDFEDDHATTAHDHEIQFSHQLVVVFRQVEGVNADRVGFASQLCPLQQPEDSTLRST